MTVTIDVEVKGLREKARELIKLADKYSLKPPFLENLFLGIFKVPWRVMQRLQYPDHPVQHVFPKNKNRFLDHKSEEKLY